MVTRKEITKKVRKIIINRCPTVKVRQGRGTGRSNVVIKGSTKYGGFTKAEYGCLKRNFPMWGAESGLLLSNEVKPFIKEFGK